MTMDEFYAAEGRLHEEQTLTERLIWNTTELLKEDDSQLASRLTYCLEAQADLSLRRQILEEAQASNERHSRLLETENRIVTDRRAAVERALAARALQRVQARQGEQ